MTGAFSPTRHGIPLLAVAMVSFAGWSIAARHHPRVASAPPIAAPTNPYDDNVAGTGIVEPASEVIAVAIERGGVASRIEVMAGDRVKAGQPLFAIVRRRADVNRYRAGRCAAGGPAVRRGGAGRRLRRSARTLRGLATRQFFVQPSLPRSGVASAATSP